MAACCGSRVRVHHTDLRLAEDCVDQAGPVQRDDHVGVVDQREHIADRRDGEVAARGHTHAESWWVRPDFPDV